MINATLVFCHVGTGFTVESTEPRATRSLAPIR
jgi:hypothetical protein